MGVRARCRECGFTWTRDAWEHCSVCHLTASGTKAGDAHRVGSYSDPADPRRCRTADELTAGGMWQTENGVWHGTWNKDGKQLRYTGPIRLPAPPSDSGESTPTSPSLGEAPDATGMALREGAA